MKKCIVCMLISFCILLALPGCSGVQREVTCDEVVAAYQKAGYSVSHHHSPELGNMVCYVYIEENDETIYFHFYETAEEAEAEQMEWNVLLWLFSGIYGDPTWVYTETYHNLEIEYTDKDMYKPFAELIK